MIVFIRNAGLCIVIFGGLSGLALCSVELVIDSGWTTLGAPEVSFDQSAAQEIFLPELFIDNSPVPTDFLITEISPILWRRVAGGPNPMVRLQISKAIGLGTSIGDVVATYDIDVDSPSPQYEKLETNLQLEPGRYFIVASSEASKEDSALWQLGERIIGNKYLASQFDESNPVDGRWVDWDAYIPPATEGPSLGLRLEAQAVPEPSSLLIFIGLGCAGFARHLRRRLRSI